jgi:hypothetical protein
VYLTENLVIRPVVVSWKILALNLYPMKLNH